MAQKLIKLPKYQFPWPEFFLIASQGSDKMEEVSDVLLGLPLRVARWPIGQCIKAIGNLSLKFSMYISMSTFCFYKTRRKTQKQRKTPSTIFSHFCLLYRKCSVPDMMLLQIILLQSVNLQQKILRYKKPMKVS